MKRAHLLTRPAPWLGLFALLSLSATLTLSVPGEAAPEPQKENRYIGAGKCKSCHSSEETGNQHGEWMSSGHAKAFEVLASPEAKKVGSERGVADPQKAPECVKCHVTGHGLPETSFAKGFEVALGVQCESCHGPGEKHQKARFAAAMGGGEDEGFGDEAETVQVPEGEIVSSPTEETCRGCHNPTSPTFKPFCFYERRDEVNHWNPKKVRTQEELDAQLVCGCGDPCPCTDSCEEHDCAVPAGKLAEKAAGKTEDGK